MVLCACQYGGEEEDGDDHGHHNDTVEFVVPHPEANIGNRVHCEGYDEDNSGKGPATENQLQKKKLLNVFFPDLKINEVGIAVYKNNKSLYTLAAVVAVAEDEAHEVASPTKLPITSINLVNVPIS